MSDGVPAARTLEVPEGGELRPSVGETKEMVVVVEVVGGQLLPFLDGCDGTTGEGEVVPDVNM